MQDKKVAAVYIGHQNLLTVADKLVFAGLGLFLWTVKGFDKYRTSRSEPL